MELVGGAQIIYGVTLSSDLLNAIMIFSKFHKLK